MAPTVRAATPSDARAIARVHIASWQVAYRGLLPDSMLDSLDLSQGERQWTANLSRSASSVDVAILDGSVAGFCSFESARDGDLGPEVGEVTAIYVMPTYWSSGIGRALLARALSELRERDFTHVALWVLKENRRARRFYEAAGFVLDGSEATKFGDLSVPEVRYQRPLTHSLDL